MIRSQAAVTVVTPSPVCLYATTPDRASRSINSVPKRMCPDELRYVSSSHGSWASGSIYRDTLIDQPQKKSSSDTYNTVVAVGHGSWRQVPISRCFGGARCLRGVFALLLLFCESFYPWRAYSVLSQGAEDAICRARCRSCELTTCRRAS